MSRARIYLRNITANYIGYGLNLLLAFFMTPFVVSRLGDTRYGLWSLLMSFTGYLGLVELGTRGGLGRFINYYMGKEDDEKVNGVISTSLGIFFVAGLVLLLVAGVIGGLFGQVFPKVPEVLVPRAQLVLALVALNVWLSILATPFRQVLTARERFDLQNALDLVILALRSGGVIAVLLGGYGLAEMGMIHAGGGLAALLISGQLARRVYPSLSMRPRLASWFHFRELFGFGIWAFIGNIAMRLLYSTDAFVIAIVLGPSRVTYYTIGGMLLIKSRMLLDQINRVFQPQMIKQCAREDWGELRYTFVRSSHLIALVGIPLLGGLIIFGREFIVLWMGPEFEISYQILLILTVSQVATLPFAAGGHIYAGMNRMRLAAGMTLAQGLINLGLTLLLVMGFDMGIVGVAWGTLVPRVIASLVGIVIVCQLMRMRVGSLLRRTVLRWILPAAIWSTIAYVLLQWPWRGTWPAFLTRVALSLVAYVPVAYWGLIPRGDRQRVISSIRRRLGGQPPADTKKEDPDEPAEPPESKTEAAHAGS